MSTTYYTKSTDFASKDTLPSGNPLKVVKGADIDQEFNNLATALNSASNDIAAAKSGNSITAEVRMYAGSAVPTGWLICDGSALSRNAYANLFNAIGTAFGAGDGSTTFNLPDMRGRVPVGAGQGTNLTNRVLGGEGGEESHTLTVAELAAHGHGVTDNGHNHHWVGIAKPTAGGNAYQNGPQPFSFNPQNMSDYWTDTNTTGISIQSTGSGTGHNTMQPFSVVNYIIKF